MPLANTPNAYGIITRSFHWLTALLIFTAIGLSFVMDDGPFTNAEEALRASFYFSLHITVGVTSFFVAVARILWGFTQPRPGLLNPDHRAEALLAELVHWSLYGAMMIMPLSGWIWHAASSGGAPILWPLGQTLPLIPNSDSLASFAKQIHILAHFVLFATIGLHVLGAVKHALIDRDATMARMVSGKSVPVPPQIHSSLPKLGALAGWAFVVAVAFATAEPPKITQTAPQTAAAGNWAVTEGSLSITFAQLGQSLTGSFGEFHADISYDEVAKTGAVTVTIPVTSLELGSVTKQAMTPEFLAPTAHPTASFKADILEKDGQLIAAGTLDLRGKEMPVTLPFSLTIDGDTARMQGQTTVDRRDFGIGPNYADEKTVGFMVTIDAALTVQRK
jgi:cytochrome b561/polyisoprenoid-binding protein YceI